MLKACHKRGVFSCPWIAKKAYNHVTGENSRSKQAISFGGRIMVSRRTCIIAVVTVVGVSAFGSRDFGLFSEANRSLAADENTKATGAPVGNQEVALAEEALKLITQSEMNGQASPGSHEASIWSRRLVEATRRSGATKPEIIEAIKQHSARMEERVSFVKRQHQAGGSTQVDVLNAQYEALEAKAEATLAATVQ
jgi:hypothetical protein